MPLEEVMRDTTALGGLALYGIVALLFLALGHGNVFAQLVIGMVLCYAVVSLLRLLFFRTRPDRQKYGGFFTKIDAGSFPSMHTTRAVVLAILLAQFFAAPLISGLLVLGVLAVAVTRVLLHRHYATDVIGGIVLGAIIGWLTVIVTPMMRAAAGF
jgi:undecaprenyl-diphosphatase